MVSALQFSANAVYSAGREKVQQFKQAVQGKLHNKFLYSDEIALKVVVYMDVQDILETSAAADLDNFAKSILDALKGPSGIMLDDTQVQSLSISWQDASEEYFTVEVRGSTDAFVLKPVSFYEMPDGLWYPHSRVLWTDGEALDAGDKNFFAGLQITETYASIKRPLRHRLRQRGVSQRKAYQHGLRLTTSLRGFHKSRVAEAGFPLHVKSDWKGMLASHQEQCPDDERAIADIMLKFKASLTELSQNL